MEEEILDSNFTIDTSSIDKILNIGDTFSELNSASIKSIKYNNIEVISTVSGLSVITNKITKVSDESWSGAPSDITSSSGTYNINYSVSFIYKGKTINKSITQKITVN